MFEKAKTWYRAIPEKKRYLEFVTALLSIPVLITVIISNVSNLNRNKEAASTTNQPKSTEKIIIITQKEKEVNKNINPSITPNLTPTASPTLTPTAAPTTTPTPTPTVTPTPTPRPTP